MFLRIEEFTEGGMVSGANVHSTFVNVDQIDTITVLEGAHGVSGLDVRIRGAVFTVTDKAAIEQLLMLLSSTSNPPQKRETLVQNETPDKE